MRLLTAATEEELSPLRELLVHDRNFQFAALGIGLADAAITSSSLIAENAFSAAFFIGSCGSYNEKENPILSIVLSQTTSLVADTNAFFPETMTTKISAHGSFLAAATLAIPNAVPADFFCPLSISTSPLRSHGVENLELFSLARTCERANIPWLGLSCVTNIVCKEGHAQWLENKSRAASLTAEAMYSLTTAI